MKRMWTVWVNLFFLFPALSFGQVIGVISSKYESLLNTHIKAYEYKDVEGSPYLNNSFTEGVIYLKDSVFFKLPLRYNIYTDEIEYQKNGVNYVIGNHSVLSRIIIGNSEYLYLSCINKGGYVELLDSGKCLLVQKSSVEFSPAETGLPIQGSVPARFFRSSDIYYIVNNTLQSFKVKNKASVTDALLDQKLKIEAFIKQEKLKKTTKENLIKIVKYYNSL